MNVFKTAIGCGFAAVMVLSSSTASGEMIDNPMYKHWAQFKPGTYVVTQSVQEAMGQKTESVTTTTLKSVSGDKVVLELASVTKVAGQEFKTPPQTMEHPARIEKYEPEKTEGEKPDVKQKTKEGDEVVEVAGKKIKTKWYDAVTDMGNMKTHTKSWMSDDFPGQIIKSTTRTEGETPMKVETKVLEYKIVK